LGLGSDYLPTDADAVRKRIDMLRKSTQLHIIPDFDAPKREGRREDK
jgi:hypothetical protein